MEERIRDFLFETFGQRPASFSKSDFGRVLVIGGSDRYPDSPVIAAKAALKTGVGYVAFCEDGFAHNPLPDEVIKEDYAELFGQDDQSFAKRINKYGAIVFGNGISNDPSHREGLGRLLESFKGILVIDATGLDALKSLGLDRLKDPSLLPYVVITPHLGEYARLFDLPYKKQDVSLFAPEEKAFADRLKITICLKGSSLSIAEDGEESCLEVEGEDPSLARAGTGDGLAGIIGGLAAYSDASTSLICAAGYSLLLMASKYLERWQQSGTFAISDIIAGIPFALREFLSK